MKKSILTIALTLTGAVVCTLSMPATASSPSSSSSVSLPSSWAPDISDGLTVNKVGDVLGPGISDHIGVMTGDLGTMTSLGEGGEFAIIFGDSFRGAKFGEGEWMSPIGAIAELDANGRIVLKRPLNEGDQVEQLIDYEHNSRGLTLLPSDIINIDGTLYMQAMWNEGVGNVLYTQIWKSTDQGQTWQSVSTTPADFLGGMANLITWEQGPDGYIYMMSSQFQRKDNVYLTRFLPEDIDDHSSWQYYALSRDGASGTWGSSPQPILDERTRAGEMSLRYIEGHWVFAMFNAETLAIEIRVSQEIAHNWNDITPAQVVVTGHGGWGQPQDAGNFTQLYGGYIVPGSTLDNLDLVVSQWNTLNNSRYMSTQFNVKGLDAFFGIDTTSPKARMFAPQHDLVGNQQAIRVEQTEVDAVTEEHLVTEKLMEQATDLTIIPLD